MNSALSLDASARPVPRRVSPHSSAPLLWSAVVLAVLAVVSLIGLAVDPRTLGGAPVWIKPLKFCISGALYVWALDVLLRPIRSRRVGAVVSWSVAAIIVAETALIAMQAARGVQSHFNVGTPFDAAVYSSMGFMIGALWVATLVGAVALLRTPSTDLLWKQATLWGLAIALAGGAVGAIMTTPSAEMVDALVAGSGVAGAHTVGAPDGGPGLAFVGWSTAGGDLRVPHFWGLHGLQVLPLLALGLVRVRALSERQRRHLLMIGGVTYAGLFGILLLQALRAQPLFQPDALILGLVAALLVSATLAAGLVARRREA